jgi:hypothetical protein
MKMVPLVGAYIRQMAEGSGGTAGQGDEKNAEKMYSPEFNSTLIFPLRKEKIKVFSYSHSIQFDSMT